LITWLINAQQTVGYWSRTFGEGRQTGGLVIIAHDIFETDVAWWAAAEQEILPLAAHC